MAFYTCLYLRYLLEFDFSIKSYHKHGKQYSSKYELGGKSSIYSFIHSFMHAFILSFIHLPIKLRNTSIETIQKGRTEKQLELLL